MCIRDRLKAIQKELGEIDEGKDEAAGINKAILKAKMPKLVQEKCLAELKKLKSMSPMSAEATVVRNYLDWMTAVSYTHLRAHETKANLVCRLLLEKKKNNKKKRIRNRDRHL